jgi:predicted nucleic acid-binding protein
VPTSDRTVYLDSSAIVKLVIAEEESDSLLQFLSECTSQLSCGLALVEVMRVAKQRGPEPARRARAVLGQLDLLRLDDTLLEDAAQLGPATLRSLDAIHLAAALALGSSLDQIVTYDIRLAEAARVHGLTVVSPGRP